MYNNLGNNFKTVETYFHAQISPKRRFISLILLFMIIYLFIPLILLLIIVYDFIVIIISFVDDNLCKVIDVFKYKWK